VRSVAAWRPARHLSQPTDRKIGAGAPASRDQRDFGPEDYPTLGSTGGELIQTDTAWSGRGPAVQLGLYEGRTSPHYLGLAGARPSGDFGPPVSSLPRRLQQNLAGIQHRLASRQVGHNEIGGGIICLKPLVTAMLDRKPHHAPASPSE